METVFQIAGLAIVAAISCCLLKPYVASLSVGLSLVACIMILFLGLGFLQPVLKFLQRLSSAAGLESSALAPMLKIVGIGILTKVSGAVCSDTGEKTLHDAVELAGVVLSLYVSLPLMSAVLDLLEEMLSG